MRDVQCCDGCRWRFSHVMRRSLGSIQNREQIWQRRSDILTMAMNVQHEFNLRYILIQKKNCV